MKSVQAYDDFCWYVVHTHPKQEDRAERNLRSLGVETFAPKVRESRYNQYTGALTHVIKHLFPRYIFALFKARSTLHKVRFTRGVHEVVSFGSSPLPVDNEIISIIQLRMSKDGFVKLDDELKTGDEVMIKDGPLRNFTAVFEREMKEVNRVMVLLEAVTYQAHVVIERDLVAKLK
jgi:transcriptional antiterminator RfaH